jgi:hypothetical protein
MSDHGEGMVDDPIPAETVAGRLAEAGANPTPGHPATSMPAASSSGEALSRGADAQPVNPDGAGDDVNR